MTVSLASVCLSQSVHEVQTLDAGTVACTFVVIHRSCSLLRKERGGPKNKHTHTHTKGASDCGCCIMQGNQFLFTMGYFNGMYLKAMFTLGLTQQWWLTPQHGVGASNIAEMFTPRVMSLWQKSQAQWAVGCSRQFWRSRQIWRSSPNYAIPNVYKTCIWIRMWRHFHVSSNHAVAR